MLKPKITALLLLICLPLIMWAQDPLAQVKIMVPKDARIRSQVFGFLQIDHFEPSKEGGIVTEIPRSMLGRLAQVGYPYEILIPDMVEYLKRENEKYYTEIKNNPSSRAAYNQTGKTVSTIIPTPAAFEVKSTFGGYYSFAEMEAAMNTLVATYPSIAQKTSLGTTYEGRDIWCIKISDNVAVDDATEPEILYLGLQHAREAITGSSMIFFMQYLCENYGVDNKITQLVNNREFYIIPCFNPDGWEYNRTSNGGNAGGGWRKNRFKTGTTGGGTYGVDLNRNWGVDWADCSAPILGSTTSCGSGTKTDETYWGASAFSEAETQAVRTLAQSKRFVAGFDQHAYGPYYSLPFGRKSKHVMPQKGIDFYTAIPALMGTYNGMRAADSYDALGYEVAGGFKDWMLMGNIGTGTKDTVWAMTGEGGAGGGTGGTYGSFWAPASQITNLCKGMCFQNLQLAFAAGTYVDIQDATDMALSATSGNLSFRLQRIGLGNDPVTVSVIPLENIQSVGSAVTVNSMTYYGTATGNIAYTLSAGIQNGQRVRFIWQVSSGGITYNDTVVKFLNPTVMLSDDMEGSFATNWLNTATNQASGFGYNYTAANWVFTTSGGYNSTKALSESAAGTNYTGSSIRTCQYKNTVNLSDATAAYLTFWTRYRAENFRDKMQVQVSTNGTTWTAVRGNLTVEETGTLDNSTINGQPALTGVQDYWSRAVYDLSAYIGNPSVSFRFVFTSDNDPSTFKFEVDEGFFIDDVKLLKSTTTFYVLPVHFLDVQARRVADRSISVNWKAELQDSHHHFEVERSTDGMQFSWLGNVPKGAPMQWTDQQPARGINYYRIKQVDANGASTYSKVVSVLNNEEVEVQAWPNPVPEQLNIQVRSSRPALYSIQVMDMQGRTIYRQDGVNSGTVQTISTQRWPSQVYAVRVIAPDAKTVQTVSIFKQ